jgi:mono/diheme cytochrome c family protein
MRISTTILAALAVVGLPGLAASAAGDAANGKRLATQWCASCHLVSAEQATATTEAPPFASMAQRPPEAIAGLEAFLAEPHAPMPQLNLARNEIRDLVAYIVSLRK